MFLEAVNKGHSVLAQVVFETKDMDMVVGTIKDNERVLVYDNIESQKGFLQKPSTVTVSWFDGGPDESDWKKWEEVLSDEVGESISKITFIVNGKEFEDFSEFDRHLTQELQDKGVYEK